MNIKGGVQHIVKKLKNNVANQVNPDWDSGEVFPEGLGMDRQDENGVKAKNSVDSFEDLKKEEIGPEKALFLEKMYRQKLSMFGIEMVVSVCISYAIAWGGGHLFTLSSFSRIILGTLLAFAVNALAVYRMIKR